MDVLTLALAKAFTRESLIGGGALKGAPCVVKSIVEDSGGNTVTLAWKLEDGTEREQSMFLAHGKGANFKLVPVRLPASGWLNKKQTISVLDVSADEAEQLIVPIPSSASSLEYYASKIRATVSADNSMEFTCETTPVVDLDAYVGVFYFTDHDLDDGVAWNLVTGKPFNTIDTVTMEVRDGVLYAKSDVTREEFEQLEQDVGDKTTIVSAPNANSIVDGLNKVDGTIWNDFQYEAAERRFIFVKKNGETMAYDVSLMVENILTRAKRYTDEAIERINTAEAKFVDVKPTYLDGTITYIKDGITETTTETKIWWYYKNPDGNPFQTIWVDGTELTLTVDEEIDLTEYVKSERIVMPKASEDDPEPIYDPDDIPSMALFDQFKKKGPEAFVFTGDLVPGAESDLTVENLSATYGDILAAFKGGSSVYGQLNYFGSMVMVIAPSVALEQEGAILFNGILSMNSAPEVLSLMLFSDGRTEFSVINAAGDKPVQRVEFYFVENDVVFSGSDFYETYANLSIYATFGTLYLNLEAKYIYFLVESFDPNEIVFSCREQDGADVIERKIVWHSDGTFDFSTKTIKETTFVAKGYYSSVTAIDSIDKTFAEIKEAIEAGKETLLLLYEDGTTDNPYVLKPSIVMQNSVNFSLAFGAGDTDHFVLIAVEINDDDTYKLHSQVVGKEGETEDETEGIDGNPVGTVSAFAGATPPDGYLLCDGAAVSRSIYSELFAVIGEIYGPGDGSTTFNLPDLSDRFVQGAGTNVTGATMAAGLPNIYGNISRMDSGGSGGISASGAFSISQNDSESANDGSGSRRYNVTFNASRHNAIYGSSTTVQPPSVIMTYIIKAIPGTPPRIIIDTIKGELSEGENIHFSEKTIEQEKPDGSVVEKPVLEISASSISIKADGMPAGTEEDPIKKDLLYVDASDPGDQWGKAVALQRHSPENSIYADGFLRYLPVDFLLRQLPETTLHLVNSSGSVSDTFTFVLADRAFFFNAYIKTGETFTSTGWHKIGWFDFEPEHYVCDPASLGKNLRGWGTVWTNTKYVNTAFQIAILETDPCKANVLMYVTQEMLNVSDINCNMHTIVPVTRWHDSLDEVLRGG